MNPDIRVFDDPRDLDRAAARWLARYLDPNRSPDRPPVLGLATGSTPVGLYGELVRLFRRGEATFRWVRTFNLDEYVGLSPDHPQSFAYYMYSHLFSEVDMSAGRCHLPNGIATDPAAEAERYESLLQRHGPIDAQLLGIGPNGHIGFNEPGTPFESRTHVVRLTEETRRANARFFNSLEEVPTEAITMGIANILEAKEILLLARGASKADAVRRAFQEEASPAVPASALQMHPKVTVYLDRAAAGSLAS